MMTSGRRDRVDLRMQLALEVLAFGRALLHEVRPGDRGLQIGLEAETLAARSLRQPDTL